MTRPLSFPKTSASVPCIAVVLLALGMACFGCAPKTPAPGTPLRDVKMDIGDYFINNNMPQNIQLKIFQFATHELKDSDPVLPWLDRAARRGLKSCKSAYVIDTIMDSSVRKYLYCVSETSITFLGAFEQQTESWVKRD